MSNLRYKGIRALIVDDFDNFRSMLLHMLQDLGVPKVDSVSTGNDALRLCSLNMYDIILCDQNLGDDPTGQQILEMLRHTSNHNTDTMFVLVTAESSKNIVIASFDHEPDDYLTKPITTHTLEQRLNRLLSRRMALTPIYKALKNGEIDEAIELCRFEINSEHRYKNYCQKMLGNLLLDTGRLDEAEQLYRDILDKRQLDWAMLGMAHVKKRKNDSLSAEQWLEEVIQFSPMCLKAYDLLVNVLCERDDYTAAQKVLQQALEFSPLSILRQQSLGNVALKNNDIVAATEAFRKAVRLGENSCYDSLTTVISFARSSIILSEINQDLAKPLLADALNHMQQLTTRFGKSNDNKASAYLLSSQLHHASGDIKRSQEKMAAAQNILKSDINSLSLSTKVEWVTALRLVGDLAESERILNILLSQSSSSEEDLQKIDHLLNEPYSIKNRDFVARVNKEGVSYFEAKEYARSADSFRYALQSFPQHVGLHLNLIQALVELLNNDPKNKALISESKIVLNRVASIITDTHDQYQRFKILEEKLLIAIKKKPREHDNSQYDQSIL